jgi:hypothetical protein
VVLYAVAAEALSFTACIGAGAVFHVFRFFTFHLLILRSNTFMRDIIFKVMGNAIQ